MDRAILLIVTRSIGPIRYEYKDVITKNKQEKIVRYPKC